MFIHRLLSWEFFHVGSILEARRVAEILKSSGYSNVSTRKAPGFLLKIMALFNNDVKGMVTFLGRKVGHDNSAARELLGWEPTPIERSIVDMARSIA